MLKIHFLSPLLISHNPYTYKAVCCATLTYGYENQVFQTTHDLKGRIFITSGQRPEASLNSNI
ncbi:MAG: hypothetical protein LBN27_05760 [Prevotellaceae bacterium]|nr:hypothetical protein [Prevotellaceae bacterium]